ncbi:hypothetical protein lerEdw1_015955 [Lerista edwardsae]|nr:hypothetical protein lerEdw1_015955 [Lerista edwardsae]
MIPSEAHQYTGIVHLLQHFQWKWIGIIALADDKGEKFAQILEYLLFLGGICTAFSERLRSPSSFLDLSQLVRDFMDTITSLSKTTVNVFVVNAEIFTTLSLNWLLFLTEMFGMGPVYKVWVMSALWDFSVEGYHRDLDVQIFQGAFSFAIHSNKVPGFQQFLRILHPHSDGDGFIRVFWEQAFNCLLSDPDEEFSLLTQFPMDPSCLRAGAEKTTMPKCLEIARVEEKTPIVAMRNCGEN